MRKGGRDRRLNFFLFFFSFWDFFLRQSLSVVLGNSMSQLPTSIIIHLIFAFGLASDKHTKTHTTPTKIQTSIPSSENLFCLHLASLIFILFFPLVTFIVIRL